MSSPSRGNISPSIYKVVESYGDYLFARNKNLWKRLGDRYLTQPEAAISEAMVFRVLQACGVPAEVADLPGGGGPDFLCEKDTPGKFMVEATSFTDDKVARDSSIPAEMGGGSFGFLTRQVDEKATAKAPQFAGIGMPGVLALGSSHFGAPLVFGAMAAEQALVSQPFWIVNKEGMSTNLASSLFLKLEDDGTIIPKNASISAVLFVSIMANQSHVCGALNPVATHRFAPAKLWQIPFIYIEWPIKDNRIRCEWTMGNTRFHTVDHERIRVDI